MDKKMTKQEALNIFLTEVFKNKIAAIFPGVELLEPERVVYYKVWCNGVNAGMELDAAIQNLRETGEI